jgi:hypothetical protein
VSKLRENAKTVIGVGVKNSSSDLFINNCDEFLYYDDLVRALAPKKAPQARKSAASPAPAAPPEASQPKNLPAQEAFAEVEKTLDALIEERGPDDPIWASMIKQAIKRRNPGFNERAYGFRSFNDLLLEAQKQGLLKLEPDQKSGSYIVRAAE